MKQKFPHHDVPSQWNGNPALTKNVKKMEMPRLQHINTSGEVTEKGDFTVLFDKLFFSCQYLESVEIYQINIKYGRVDVTKKLKEFASVLEAFFDVLAIFGMKY